MKKSVKILGISVGAVVGLAIIASVAVSLIADPAKYKPEIEKAFLDATGYKLSINGDIGVSLLPLPKAYVQGVTVTNGAKQLVEVEQINIYPEILPLLSGKKKISSILVKSPIITLEKAETGDNWATPEDANKDKPKSAKADLSIDNIEIENGKLQFSNRLNGQNHVMDKINIDASLASVDGPVNVDGKLEYNGMPMDVKASISNFADPKIFANIETKESKIKFDGAKTGGKLVLSSTDLAPLLSAAGMNNKMLSGRALSFDGDVKYEDEVVTIINSKFSFGHTAGNLDLAAQFGERETAATINLSANKLDVDELIGEQKESDAAPDTKPVEKNDAEQKLRVELTALADEVIFKGASYKKLNVNASVEDDTITVRPFTIQTPGQGSVETYGVLIKTNRGWTYDGNIAAGAGNMREMITAVTGNKLEGINQKGLKKFDLQSNITASVISGLSTINLSNVKMLLDESNVSGALTVKTENPIAVSFKGSVDKLNYNNYSVAPTVKDAGTSGGLKGNKKLDFEWLRKLPVSADITATIGQLTNKAETYTNIRIDGKARPGDIDFKEFSANLQTFSIGAIFSLNIEGQRPRFKIDANIDHIKLDDITNTDKQQETAAGRTGGQWSEKVFNFSPLDQIDGSIKASIGSISGDKINFGNVTMVGNLNNGTATLNNFYSDVFGGSINMNGELAISAVPSIKFSFAAENIDMAQAVNGLVTSWPISGRTSLNGSFSSAGVHQKAMVNNLNGSTTINATNISVRGLDLASFGYNLLNMNDPMALVAVLKNVSGDNKASTQMTSAGTIYAEKGVLKTAGVQVQSDAAQGVVTGYMDLNKWYMDGDAKFNMAVADKKSPAFGIHMFGPPDALKKEYDTKDLEKYIAERGIVSQNKIDLLKPGGLENKLNDKLMKQLGIQKPSATPAPATTAPTTTVPVTGQPEAAAQPATEQPQLTDKEKKRDAQKQLINQGIQQLFGGQH